MAAIQSPRQPQECWSFFASIQEGDERGERIGEGGMGERERERIEREKKGNRDTKVEIAVYHATQLQTSSGDPGRSPPTCQVGYQAGVAACYNQKATAISKV